MSGDSYVLGLVGAGIDRSLTPAMQEAEGRAHGLSLGYRIVNATTHGLGVDDLPDLLRWARRLGFDGLNDWAGTENYEMRVDPGGAWIDQQILDRLRDATPGITA